jgi:GNAT superfamily N-acetyltransferase
MDWPSLKSLRTRWWPQKLTWKDLFVLEKYRGKSYGKKLLAKLAALALERNCGRLEWAVLDWNEPSIEFYKSLGASSLDEWLINRLSGKDLAKLATEF